MHLIELQETTTDNPKTKRLKLTVHERKRESTSSITELFTLYRYQQRYSYKDSLKKV